MVIVTLKINNKTSYPTFRSVIHEDNTDVEEEIEEGMRASERTEEVVDEGDRDDSNDDIQAEEQVIESPKRRPSKSASATVSTSKRGKHDIMKAFISSISRPNRKNL